MVNHPVYYCSTPKNPKTKMHFVCTPVNPLRCTMKRGGRKWEDVVIHPCKKKKKQTKSFNSRSASSFATPCESQTLTGFLGGPLRFFFYIFAIDKPSLMSAIFNSTYTVCSRQKFSSLQGFRRASTCEIPSCHRGNPTRLPPSPPPSDPPTLSKW